MPNVLPVTPPLYATEVSRTVLGPLQCLQAMMQQMPGGKEPTLADVAVLIATMQYTFDPGTTLETVIQSLVAQDLQRQYCERRRLTFGLDGI